MKYIERVAYVLLLLAIIMAFREPLIARYVASIGAAGVAIVRLRERYEGPNVRLKRLMRLRHLVGIGYVVGAGLMFKEQNYWLVAFGISVLIELYTIFVYDHETKKDNVSKDKNQKNK